MKYVICFFLTGCAPLGTIPTIRVAPEMALQYTLFVNELYSRKMAPVVNEIIVEFADDFHDPDHPFRVGSCNYGNYWAPAKVRILRRFWDGASDLGREQLMHHELGHCLLGRGHLDEMIMGDYQGETIPKSIMTSWEMDDTTYLEHHEYYIHELFGR